MVLAVIMLCNLLNPADLCSVFICRRVGDLCNLLAFKLEQVNCLFL
jgi:hypothetical protein